MKMRVHTSIGLGALWTTAALAAVAGHAAVAAIALNWTSGESAPPAAPPVLMISLAPIAAPQVPEQQVAPGPQAADSVPEQEQKLPAKAMSELDIPKLPEKKEEAVAMLPPPMPEPKPEVKPVVRETPVEAKKEERKKERRVASRASAPTTFEAPRADQAHAPAAGAARVSASALASWKGDLMAELNRHKRYPSGSSSNGTAIVAFSINRSGAVTSARLARSSGDSALDEEAVSLPRRASPLPKPPDGVGGGTIALSVPIRFGR